MRRGTARKKLPALGENSDNTRCVGPSTAKPTPALALTLHQQSLLIPWLVIPTQFLLCKLFTFSILHFSTGGSKNCMWHKKKVPQWASISYVDLSYL